MFRCLVMVLLASVALTQLVSDDRCASHVCVPHKDVVIPKADSEFTTDPTTCAYETCEKCLIGDDWDLRRAELGTGSATRNVNFSLVINDWLSAELTETTFRILAEEMMGYKLEALPLYIDGFDMLCCERDLIYMEKWPSEVYPDDDGYFSLTQLGVGYEGGVGIYVSQHTVDAYPLATAYNAYKHLDEYKNMFDKAGSTPCIEGSWDLDIGCESGNYFCDFNEWTNTSCSSDGRYVPPQCNGVAYSDCQELLSMYSENESGFFEALIRNNNLNFTLDT